MNEMFLTTFLYYTAIAVASAIVASFAVKNKYSIQSISNSFRFNEVKVNMPMYILSAIILFVPLIFTDNGTDRTTYVMMFQNIKFEQIFNFEHEMIFMLINFLLRLLGDSPYILFTFFYGLFIFNIYFVIYQFREEINIPTSIIIFALLFYIQSINLMRIYVAASILLVATFYLYKKKNLKCILFTVVAGLIHYSAFLYFAVILLVKFYELKKINFNVKTVILLVCMVIAVVSFILLVPVLKAMPTLERYQYYFDAIDITNIGFYQFFVYAPIICFVMLYKNKFNNNTTNIAMANLILAFFLAIIGYFMIIIGRTTILFTFPFIIWIPKLIKELQDEVVTSKNGLKTRNLLEKPARYMLTIAFIAIYVLVRYTIYMQGYIISDDIGVLLQ